MSKIEWCDETINPIVGCSKVSPACDNCYAEVMAKRLQSMGTCGYDGVVTDKGKWSGKLNFIESELEKPAKWKKPKRIFVGSMTDIFHDNVPFGWVYDILTMVVKYPQHTYIFLTKRPRRMKDFFTWLYTEQRDNWMTHFAKEDIGDFIPNLWLGVTAENQEQANTRVPILLDTPAVKRFVSVEPVLSKINLDMLIKPEMGDRFREVSSSLMGVKTLWDCGSLLVEEKTNKLDWIIVGGESGHNARITNPKWVLSLKQQCEDSKVPFFFKQWGEFIEESQITDKPSQMKGKTYSLMSDGELTFWRCGKKLTGKLIDGKEHIESPKMEVI